MSEPTRNRQATWKTLLIIGIIGAVVWLFTLFGGDSTNVFDAATHTISGLVALIGLLGGLILFITSRKDS